MKELHKLGAYDFETVESFIKNSIEESIYIEFKAAGALSKNDSAKKEVSKDVSAFANSDGGIIIYGIAEKNHKADNFSFIDGNEFNKEWLEQIINSTINRNIPDLKIFPIRREGKIENSIYVVQIPSSIEAPHMSRDKRFYRRFNFESVAMEEYEIRQLYGRKVKSKLIVNGYRIAPQNATDKDDDNYDFLCEVSVFNKGEKVEKDYKINAYFVGKIDTLNISWNAQNSSRDNDYTRYNNDRIKVSATGKSPIYPNELLNVLRFNFSIKKTNIIESLKNIKMEFRLYYPNGEDFIDTDLKMFIEKLNLIDDTK